VDGLGRQSESSATVSIELPVVEPTLPLPVPSGVTANVADEPDEAGIYPVTISWLLDTASDDVAGFEVFAGEALAGTIEFNTARSIEIDFAAGTEVALSVQTYATDGRRSERSTAVDITTPDASNPPVIPTAVELAISLGESDDGAQVAAQLAWNLQTDTDPELAQGFEVFIQSIEEPASEPATLFSIVIDDGGVRETPLELPRDRTLLVTIQTHGPNELLSAISDAVQITTGPLPEPVPVPADLTASIGDIDESGSYPVTLYWSFSEDDDTSSIVGYEALQGDQILSNGNNGTDRSVVIDLAALQTVSLSLRAVSSDGRRSIPSSAVEITTPASSGDSECPAYADASHRFTFDSPSQAQNLNDQVTNLTLVGAATGVTDGVIGEAILMESGASLELPEFAVPLGPEGLTVSAWVRPDDLGSIEARFLSQATGTSGNEHTIMLSAFRGSAVRFRLRTSASTTTVISPTGLLSAGVWSHVTGVWNGSVARLYHNGVLVAQKQTSGSFVAANNVSLAVGNQPSGAGDRPFSGALDEIAFHARPLDASEVAELTAQPALGCLPATVDPDGDVTPPTTPEGLIATATGPSTVSLVWNESTDTQSDVEAYVVRRGGEIAGETSTLVFMDEGLLAEHAYTYTVSARDSADPSNVSVPSVSAAVTTPASSDPFENAEPQAFTVTEVSDVAVSLAWQPPTDVTESVASYELFRDNDLIAQTVGLSWTDDELAPLGEYTYKLVAIDDREPPRRSRQVELTISTTASPDVVPPLAPTNLRLDEVSETTATVTWSEVTDESGIAGYTLVRDGEIVIDLLPDTTWTDEQLQPNQAYEYRVTSTDNRGNTSAPSTPLNIVTLDTNTTIDVLFANARIIYLQAASTVRWGDFDGDGDKDLFVADGGIFNQDAPILAWFELPEGTRHDIGQPLTPFTGDSQVADIDLDLVGRHLSTNRFVIWFQNSPDDWQPKRIETRHREGLHVADLDGDDLPDIVGNGFILFAPSDPRTGEYTEVTFDDSFYSPEFPREEPWQRTLIETPLEGNHQLELADMDNDGDIDIVGGFSFGGTGVYWWRNLDGFGTAFRREIINTSRGCYSCVTADYDGDGDIDVAGPSEFGGRVRLFENLLIE